MLNRTPNEYLNRPFIELTRRDGTGITINSDHILTISTQVGRDAYRGNDKVASAGEVVTEIQLAGPLPAMAFIQVTESYAEVCSLIGLEVEA